VAVGVPFGRGLAEALTVSAGRCADACPTGALTRRQQPAGDRVALPFGTPERLR
jgi:NADH dehydrogenase/NADH:ubiquinone oxidoreductase subunit G